MRARTDSLKLRGYLEFVLRDARTGKLIKKGKTKNTVSCAGRGWALERLIGASSNANVFSFIAVGSVSSAPASNQSAMGGYMTIKAIGTQGFTSATNTTCKYTAAFSFASNETWSGSSQIGEFALYNQSATNAASAVMFNRVNTTTYINFDSTNTLAATITITN